MRTGRAEHDTVGKLRRNDLGMCILKQSTLQSAFKHSLVGAEPIQREEFRFILSSRFFCFRLIRFFWRLQFGSARMQR